MRSRLRFHRWGTVATLALASLSAPMFVFAAGSDGKPSASAAAKPAEAPAASAAAGKPAEKADGGVSDAGPVDGSALPPGHPRVGDELPQGHPNVGNNPHGDPHGDDEEAQGGRGIFEAPPDMAIEDPSLPAGSIIITIKDADDKPIPKASAVLSILESSVAKGDTRKRRSIETDDQGSAVVDGLPVGAGMSYRVTTTRDVGTFASEPFGLTAKAGKRVILHAYESTPNVEKALVGMQAFVFISLKEDVLSVEHTFRIYNIGKTAWVPDSEGAKMMLPDTHKAFNVMDSMSDVKFVEGAKHDASLTGTIGPGQNEASFRYHVPLDGSARQTFRVTLPPRVGEVRVFSEAGKAVGLDVAGFPAAQKQRGNDGRKLWITGRAAQQGEHGVRTLEISITGLPTPGPGRWIAVICAISALGVAGAFVAKQQKEGDTQDDIRDDLVEARDALLGEFVTLEKARKKGDIGPKTYERLRTALLDALARIEARLDEVRAARAARKKENRVARVASRGDGGAS
jgi:hypothetical protein